MYSDLPIVGCLLFPEQKLQAKSWIETRISVLASGLSVKQFDTHCIWNENIVMETRGREVFVIAWHKQQIVIFLIVDNVFSTLLPLANKVCGLLDLCES